MASDVIWREVELAKKVKPVVVSMGDYAASGGYYVSAPCDYIVANELTLTGSIGVIMSTFNYRGLMDKVGLQPRVFKSGKFKDMLRGSKLPEEMDPAVDEMMSNRMTTSVALGGASFEVSDRNLCPSFSSNSQIF